MGFTIFTAKALVLRILRTGMLWLACTLALNLICTEAAVGADEICLFKGWSMVFIDSPGQPREGTALLQKRPTRWRRGTVNTVVLATGLLAVGVLMAIFHSGREVSLKSVDSEIAQIEVENRKLEQEEASLVQLASKQPQKRHVVVKRAPVVPRKIVHKKLSKDATLEAENLKLLMENAELKHEVLMDRFDKSGMAHRIEKDLHLNQLAAPKGFKVTGLSRYNAVPKHKIQQLVGEYVKTCTPWGCKITYQPEDGDMNMTWYPGRSSTNKSNVWYGKGYQHLVNGNQLGLPLGPIRKANITRYEAPYGDLIPKHSKLGDNWIGFGHADSFVRIENSAIGGRILLPPWKQGPLENFNNYNNTMKPFPGFQSFIPNGSDPSAYKEVNISYAKCPGDPEGKTGKLCISGGDGVDGVFESSPFAPTYYDPNKELMEKHGVLVDNWPGFSEPKHQWGGDAKDHFKQPSKPEFFDYDKAKHPYWAYDNHAMRSLPEYHDPDGVANRQLMLGAYWNSSHAPLPDLDDNWVDNSTYAAQFEPGHVTMEMEEDHFSNWSHLSPENVRLLYGETPFFSGLRRKGNTSEVEADPWSLGDVPVNASQLGDIMVGSAPRTGEPLHDIQNGWQGQDLVASNDANLQSAAGTEPFEGFLPSAGRMKLEKKGVNVGSYWWN